MMTASEFSRRIESECPAFQARVAARALTRYYNAHFRSLGVTAEQFSLLVGIAGSNEPTLAELAARAGVDATTLSRSVVTLERSNLVRSHGGRGRAGKRLTLTDDGHQLMEKLIAVWESAHTELTEALGEDTSHIARSIMSQLAIAAQTATSAAYSEEVQYAYDGAASVNSASGFPLKT